MGELADESRIFLSTLQPERRERRLAMTAVALSVVLFATLAPFVRIQMPQVWAFIPIYQSAIVICDLITAGLLLGQFGILRTPSLVVLAGGYVLNACMARVHMLTFPGLFLPSGLLDAGPQTTAWLYMFWHSGFPLCVIFYTLASRRERAEPLYAGRLALPVIVCIGTALVATGAFAALATSGRELLPPNMANNHYTPLMRGVVTTVWLMTLAALILLTSRRPHSVLDLWLIVVLCAWLLDIALSAVLNHGRFDLGFYAGRVYGLVASSFVLLALLLENGKLYARTVHALQGERIEHRRVQEKTVQLNEANELLEQRVAERTRAQQARLAPYVAALLQASALLREGRDLTEASKELLELPEAARCFLLDASGRQIGDNVLPRVHASQRAKRFSPLLHSEGASWERRPYFIEAMRVPGRAHFTPPYLSINEAHLCVTASIATPAVQGMQVLCVDINWEAAAHRD